LSDDQGWRIEIKSWPNLTSHGGSTEVGGGKGGFYTQEQYKDLVNYAQERYVTIVPEIDLPGHTNAALASYPELNCNDTAPALYTKTEVGFSTLCVKKDITYKFIDDVVRELAAITPGPYIHLGGDESHATKKEDFIFFINKIQGIPKKYGKKMIGWEEIAQANLDSSTIVQFWQNAEYAKEAVKKGAKIIMSPATRVYLDMKYDSTTKLGQDWAARIEIDSSYLWSPSQFVKGIPHESILGIEAPLWTETITSMNEIEYMVFPRLAGIAEIAWSPEEGRTWDEYKTRLARHASRMKAMDIDFYESKQVTWEGEKNK
jgi:hexosaminidase